MSKSYSTDTANQEKQRRKELVSDGIDIILSLFIAAGQQRLFPRTIMTKNLDRQIKFNNTCVGCGAIICPVCLKESNSFKCENKDICCANYD